MSPGILVAGSYPPTASVSPTGGAVDLASDQADWPALAVPANQGSSGDYGYADPAVGNWDSAPYQTYTTVQTVGVDAYHQPTLAQQAAFQQSNIDHVSCAVDGGPLATVYAPTLNTETGVVDYVFTIDPSTMNDGPHEMRCTITPTTGLPLVLQGDRNELAYLTSGYTSSAASFMFSTNSHGTLASPTIYISNSGSDTTGNGTSGNPYATITKARNVIAAAEINRVDDGVICLAPGSYVYGDGVSATKYINPRGWLTIQPCGSRRRRTPRSPASLRDRPITGWSPRRFTSRV